MSSLRRFVMVGVSAAGLFLASLAPAAASPIFLVNENPDRSGLTFANSVVNYTTPVYGAPTDILGLPDAPGNIAPGIVDFAGAVTVGFGVNLADRAGVDARVFVTQLDPTEGFSLFAGPTASNLTFLGIYPGPASSYPGAQNLAIDIDFNGMLPANSQFLRFVAPTPLSLLTYGTDFDAVGVFAAPVGESATGESETAAVAPVPEPGTMLLVGAGLVALVRARRKMAR
jgi:PEP-CTERM motif-containing protein